MVGWRLYAKTKEGERIIGLMCENPHTADKIVATTTKLGIKPLSYEVIIRNKFAIFMKDHSTVLYQQVRKKLKALCIGNVDDHVIIEMI